MQISPLDRVQVFQAQDEMKGSSVELYTGSNQWKIFMVLQTDEFVYNDNSQRASFMMLKETGTFYKFTCAFPILSIRGPQGMGRVLIKFLSNFKLY